MGANRWRKGMGSHSIYAGPLCYGRIHRTLVDPKVVGDNDDDDGDDDDDDDDDEYSYGSNSSGGENIYDSFVKAKKKAKKKDKSETPLQEGLDNGMMNGNEWSRLDDDDYDGHDNVDDEGADIDAGMGISEGINWLREMVKYIFDMIETFFYMIAIFIYLIFSLYF